MERYVEKFGEDNTLTAYHCEGHLTDVITAVEWDANGVPHVTTKSTRYPGKERILTRKKNRKSA